MFIRSSTDDYQKPDAERDRVVKSFDGFNSYLDIVDDHARYTWIFLCRSKNPPVELENGYKNVVGQALEDGIT